MRRANDVAWEDVAILVSYSLVVNDQDFLEHEVFGIAIKYEIEVISPYAYELFFLNIKYTFTVDGVASKYHIQWCSR